MQQYLVTVYSSTGATMYCTAIRFGAYSLGKGATSLMRWVALLRLKMKFASIRSFAFVPPLALPLKPRASTPCTIAEVRNRLSVVKKDHAGRSMVGSSRLRKYCWTNSHSLGIPSRPAERGPEMAFRSCPPQ